MTIINQLEKLAELAPDICQQSATKGHWVIDEYVFFEHEQYGFMAYRCGENGRSYDKQPALDWLQGALQRSIEAREWDWTCERRSALLRVEILQQGITYSHSAVRALLGALIQAVK